jgi:hypothetical protein
MAERRRRNGQTSKVLTSASAFSRVVCSPKSLDHRQQRDMGCKLFLEVSKETALSLCWMVEVDGAWFDV